MVKEMKRIMAEDVRADLANSADLLVIGLLNMDAVSNHELRSHLRAQGARLRVIHNRTCRFALDEARKPIADFFSGQTAIALSDGPDVEFAPVAKALVEAAKKGIIEVRGGYIDDEMLDKADVIALAKAPDKPTLRAMLLSAINGSARGLAATLQGVGEGIARCLQARVDATGESEVRGEDDS